MQWTLFTEQIKKSQANTYIWLCAKRTDQISNIFDWQKQNLVATAEN